VRRLASLINDGRLTEEDSTIKDADQIFVMGDGLVLEQGTHSELLADEDGPYTCLVQAQKLRERQDTSTKDLDTASGEENEDIEKAVREEVPLGRKNTGHSLASEILEKRRREGGGDIENGGGDPDHTLTYLFKRMGLINREGWIKYAFGTMFAIRMLCIIIFVYF
jgi:ATP-binding cassette subfamily B (MDR/TAP) protein 1